MMHMIVKLWMLLAGAAILTGCQTPDAPSPAVLESADDDAMAALHAALADTMGRAKVELGPGDLTEDPAIAVLPPPLGPGEDRSLATPTYFDLMVIGEACVVVHRETGAQYALDDVSCRPL